MQTFNVSTNIPSPTGERDYELETLLEAESPKQAAMMFLRDWDRLATCFGVRDIVVCVSEPIGLVHLFVLRNNILYQYETE